MKLKENQDIWIQVRKPGSLPNGIPSRLLRKDEEGILVEFKSTEKEKLYSKKSHIITEYDDHIDIFCEDGTFLHIFDNLKTYDEYTDTATGRFEKFVHNGFSNISKIFIRKDGKDMFTVDYYEFASSYDLQGYRDFNIAPLAPKFIHECLEEAKRRIIRDWGNVKGFTADFILDYIPYHTSMDDIEVDLETVIMPQKSNPA